MTLCMSSASAVTRFCKAHENLVALAAADSELFRGKLLCFSGRHHVNQCGKACHLFINHTETRVPRTLAFATGSRKDEAERGSSLDALSDDVISSRCTESFESPNSKVDFSYPESKSTFSGRIWNDQASVLDKLNALRFHVLASEKWNASQLDSCDRKYLACATNLIHYMALKSLDVKQFNSYLTSLGLSSLDETNLDVLARLNAIIQLLQNSLPSKESLDGESFASTDPKKPRSKNSKKINEKEITLWNKELLLGNLSEDRRAHIMVTVGKEAV